mgnify:CR=1 FL=1
MNTIKQNEYCQPFESLYKLNIGLSLDEYETEEAMSVILNEKDKIKRTSLLSALLNGIMIKGPTINEVQGLLNASLKLDNVLNKRLKIEMPNGEPIIGVASSGKKGIKTINITSVACFVAAACGVKIAKACSHSTSSKTGSSDFLDICGLDLNIPFKNKIEILKKYNIAFFSIEETTPKFAELYGGLFYVPHAISFALAGLSFPIKIDALAYGLSHPNVKLSAEVLKSFGIKNALAYSSTFDGIHFMDELLPIGRVNFARIKNGYVERTISADIQDTLNVNSTFKLQSIKEKFDKTENVIASLKILRGEGELSQIDAICVNSAIFLLLANKANSLKEGYEIAKNKLKSHKIWDLFINVLTKYRGNEKHIKDLLFINNQLYNNSNLKS